MTMHTTTGEAALLLAPTNIRAPVFHEVLELTQTAQDAIDNSRVGRMSTWMLGAAIVSALGGASVYFLAVSPYVIDVLAPLFQA